MEQCSKCKSLEIKIEELRQAQRETSERLMESEAQVAVFHSAIAYIHTEDGRHSKGFLIPCEACQALSSDAGKRHLELDALKDRALAELRLSHFSVGQRTNPDCPSCLALSALEAKEKEALK